MIISVTDPFYLTVAYILCGLLGLCVGSFLNVVIYRVPLGMSVARPASHCPLCSAKIRLYDNIPIVSYILLGGKCRSCKGRIPFRYTAVEALNCALWLLCVLVYHTNLIFMIVSCAVCSVCICVFFIDLEHMIIPDRFQVILGVLAVASVFFDTEYDWLSHLIGLAAALVVFIAVGYAVSRYKKRESLGGGDIKFAACAGLLLGWQRFILMMLIASVSASVVLLIKSKRSKDETSKEYPFGPFLATGAVLALLFGHYVIEWYIKLLVG